METETAEKKDRKIPLVVQVIASIWILIFSLLKFFMNGDADGVNMFTYTIDEVVKSGMGFMLCYMPELIYSAIDRFLGGKK